MKPGDEHLTAILEADTFEVLSHIVTSCCRAVAACVASLQSCPQISCWTQAI